MTCEDRLEGEVAGHHPGAGNQQLVVVERGRIFGRTPVGGGGAEEVDREGRGFGLVFSDVAVPVPAGIANRRHPLPEQRELAAGARLPTVVVGGDCS